MLEEGPQARAHRRQDGRRYRIAVDDVEKPIGRGIGPGLRGSLHVDDALEQVRAVALEMLNRVTDGRPVRGQQNACAQGLDPSE